MGVGPPLEVKVWGDFACFTRPEMKVERVSYPVMCVFRTNPTTIPTGKRPPFRPESDHHSDSNPTTIPEQSGQCDLRV